MPWVGRSDYTSYYWVMYEPPYAPPSGQTWIIVGFSFYPPWVSIFWRLVPKAILDAPVPRRDDTVIINDDDGGSRKRWKNGSFDGGAPATKFPKRV